MSSTPTDRPQPPQRAPEHRREAPAHGRSGQGTDSLLAHLKQERQAKAVARAAKKLD